MERKLSRELEHKTMFSVHCTSITTAFKPSRTWLFPGDLQEIAGRIPEDLKKPGSGIDQTSKLVLFRGPYSCFYFFYENHRN